MFSAWMVGLEVEPEDCGEICLVEVFGDTLADGPVAAVGHGIKRIRDPRLREDFVADPRPLDVTEPMSTRSTGGPAQWTSCSTVSSLRTVAAGAGVPHAAHRRGLRLPAPCGARTPRTSRPPSSWCAA
jgi:hypothetical protein